MTTLDTSTLRMGRRRRPAPAAYEAHGYGAPRSEESVPRRLPDPPIYGALLDRWAADGRTLPGRRDPEWVRVASSPIWPTGPLFGSTGP
ncbi:hypothetical protein [Streptomyces sp. NPDC048606]|uniref:hypothetical protein n=1 Tax=Streptomyces sp. NPDC048606 TaxID=3154726 RepID=UPI0034260F1F